MTAPTFEQAKAIWKGRLLGRKVRDICSEFDVDPRRLYEVWQEEVHVGSRNAAYLELKQEFPESAPSAPPEIHKPRFMIVPIETQLDLFDRSA